MTESFEYTVQYNKQERQGSVTLSICSSLDFLKKKLLRKFNYLASNIEKINLFLRIGIDSKDQTCYPVPLLNTSDMFGLIRRELDCGRPIEFVFESKDDLTPVAQRKKTAKVQFDSDGDLESIDSDFEFVIPSDPIYKGKVPVVCSFCHRSSSDIESVKFNGPLIGPFKVKNYTHLLCALWAPKVYLQDQTDKLINIEKEIKRGRRTYCFYCGEKGGVLDCQQCKVTAHFDCAMDKGSELDWQKYTMICKKCTSKTVNSTSEQGKQVPSDQIVPKIEQL